MKKEYFVTLAVDARITIPVIAENFEDAKEKACMEFSLTEINCTSHQDVPLEYDVVKSVPVNATDTDDNMIDY